MKLRRETQARFTMVFVIIVVLNFQRCDRLEDGPLYGLTSKTKRISNKWELKEQSGRFPVEAIYERWGQEVEIVDYRITFDFEEDGDFEQRGAYTLQVTSNYGYYGPREYTFQYNIDRTGDWEFSSDKEEVEIEYDRRYGGYGYGGNNMRGQDYKILRLKQDELILEAEDGSEWVFED